MVKAEAVHTDRAPARHQPAQIRKVVGIAAVTDDDAPQIDALLGEDGLLRLAGAARGPRVR